MKHRRAYFLPRCVSTTTQSIFVSYGAYEHLGRILKDGEAVKWSKRAYNITCYPLYTILKAADVKRVDYLSVDVEGWELAILKTIPFEKLDIKVISLRTFPE